MFFRSSLWHPRLLGEFLGEGWAWCRVSCSGHLVSLIFHCLVVCEWIWQGSAWCLESWGSRDLPGCSLSTLLPGSFRHSLGPLVAEVPAEVPLQPGGEGKCSTPAGPLLSYGSSPAADEQPPDGGELADW